MPEVVGRLRTPRLASAPSSPAVGEVYYDTALSVLYWWNGTSWISAAGTTQLDYNGGFPTGTPYTDGDIVVYNGIAYMCVRPTSAAPTPWMTGGLQGLEAAYGQFTGDVPITAITEATATTIVTASAFTADGTSAYLIDFYCPQVTTPAAGATLAGILYDGAASVGWLFAMVFGTISQQMPIKATRRLVPAAGAHTYSIRAFRSGASNAAFTAGAGGAAANVPGFIRIVRAS
jgi:hypothetical protein